MRQERSAQVECPWAIDYQGETLRCVERAGHGGDHLGAWRDEAVTFPQAARQDVAVPSLSRVGESAAGTEGGPASDEHGASQSAERRCIHLPDHVRCFTCGWVNDNPIPGACPCGHSWAEHTETMGCWCDCLQERPHGVEDS